MPSALPGSGCHCVRKGILFTQLELTRYCIYETLFTTNQGFKHAIDHETPKLLFF